MTLWKPFLWILTLLGLMGPPDSSTEKPSRDIVVIAVPQCLCGDLMPFMLTPGGHLLDVRGHDLDCNRLGQLMRSRADGSPSVLEILVLDEGASEATFSETVRRVRAAQTGWVDDYLYGPPNAIVFLYTAKLDPLAWYYRWLSQFPGPLSRLPKLGTDGHSRIINGRISLP